MVMKVAASLVLVRVAALRGLLLPSSWKRVSDPRGELGHPQHSYTTSEPGQGQAQTNVRQAYNIHRHLRAAGAKGSSPHGHGPGSVSGVSDSCGSRWDWSIIAAGTRGC